MNRQVLVVGCDSVGRGVARALLRASCLGDQGRVVVIDNKDDSEGVLVLEEDGTIQLEAPNTDELQMLVALLGPPTTFSTQLTLHARDFICHEEFALTTTNRESKDERKAHWQQSHASNNRKFQSMQAKARRR